MSVCKKVSIILSGHKANKDYKKSSPYCGTELSVLCGSICGSKQPQEKKLVYEDDVS